ncbi:MAG: ROK family transcriptional regulator [Gemmataceae bacterium]
MRHGAWSGTGCDGDDGPDQTSLLGKMTERVLPGLAKRAIPLSRAEVSRESGLSAPSVSRAVTALLRAGLVEETSQPQPTGGRPANLLRLACKSAQVLGISVDVDRCCLVSAGLDGEPHDDPIEFPTPTTYPDLIASLARQSRQLMHRGNLSTLGIGLSLPGLVDYRIGQSLLSPNLAITNGKTPALDLSRKLGMDVLLLQESHALCLAEQYHGEARDLLDFAMLDIHTGLGLGVVSGGRLLTGHSGVAGELGHVTVEPNGKRCGCGNIGCLETVANDTSLAWRVSRRLGRPVTIDEVIHLAQASHHDFSGELADVCRYLAIAVAAVLNLFNPRRLFVHGRLFEVDPSLFSRLIDLVSRRALRPCFEECRIVRATAKKHQGALAGIIQHLTSVLPPTIELNPLRLPTEVRDALPAT